MPDSLIPSGVDEHSVFRTLFAAYPDGLIVTDTRGVIVLANPAATALLGYDNDELVGLNVDVLVPDGIRPRHASYRQAYGQHPKPRPMGTQMDLVAKRRDGSEVMVEIALSPLQNQGLPLVVAAIRDIGAYPRVKQALQRARYSEHLAQLGRLAVDARDANDLLAQVPGVAAEALQVETSRVLLLEPDQRHLRIAAGFGAVPGEPVSGLLPIHPDTPAGLVLREGRAVVIEDLRTETRFTAPEAHLEAGFLSGLAVPLLDRGRTIGALSVGSHEARRFGEHEVRFLESLSNLLGTSLQRAQSEEALNHAQRLESVGQLTGGIAHDFNNLLTIIGGNLQVLEELPTIAHDDHGRELVAAASRAARRGAELTGKLLAFSRRQVLSPSTIDVAAMLQSLADMLRRTLDQRIRIDVDAPPGGLNALADAAQLESALLNIAINARDAMPEGGTLRFHAEVCEALPVSVLRDPDDRSAQTEGFVAISIEDSGSGMPDAIKERAFEPFFTTKEAGRGTGLGLSTVYGFVKQSNGAVSLDSELGRGTTLTLYIPCPPTSGFTPMDDDSAPRQVPAGLRVLLVEDDADVRAVALKFLDMLGCKVTAASNAEQALLSLGPEARFDLLLTDIALGSGMRGTRLAAEAQARFPDLAILLMSGFSAELLEADRESPPSWELLPKPYTRDALAQAIARVMMPR
jgi:PAS domain S-box-containing protein